VRKLNGIYRHSYEPTRPLVGKLHLNRPEKLVHQGEGSLGGVNLTGSAQGYFAWALATFPKGVSTPEINHHPEVASSAVQ